MRCKPRRVLLNRMEFLGVDALGNILQTDSGSSESMTVPQGFKTVPILQTDRILLNQ